MVSITPQKQRTQRIRCSTMTMSSQLSKQFHNQQWEYLPWRHLSCIGVSLAVFLYSLPYLHLDYWQNHIYWFYWIRIPQQLLIFKAVHVIQMFMPMPRGRLPKQNFFWKNSKRPLIYPPHFWKIILRISLQNCDKSA